MYYLVDNRNKKVLMKDGTPFIYSNQRLAELGRKWLSKKRHQRLRAVEAPVA